MLHDRPERSPETTITQFNDSPSGQLWKSVALRVLNIIFTEGYYRKVHFLREKRGRVFEVVLKTTEGKLYYADLLQERQRSLTGEIYELSISTKLPDEREISVNYIYNTGDARGSLAHLYDGHLPGLTMIVREDPKEWDLTHRYLEEKEYLPILSDLSRAEVEAKKTLENSEMITRMGWKIRWVKDRVKRKLLTLNSRSD